MAFTCQHCGGTFEKGWTEEEARAESLANFGPLSENEEAEICDDCYKPFVAWFDAKVAAGEFTGDVLLDQTKLSARGD